MAGWAETDCQGRGRGSGVESREGNVSGLEVTIKGRAMLRPCPILRLSVSAVRLHRPLSWEKRPTYPPAIATIIADEITTGEGQQGRPIMSHYCNRRDSASPAITAAEEARSGVPAMARRGKLVL